MSSTKSVAAGKAAANLLPVDPQPDAPSPQGTPDKTFAKIMVGLMAGSLAAAAANGPAAATPKPDSKQKPAAGTDPIAAPVSIVPVPVPTPPAPVPAPATAATASPGKEPAVTVPLAGTPGEDREAAASIPAQSAPVPAPVLPARAAQNSPTSEGKPILPGMTRITPAATATQAPLATGAPSKDASSANQQDVKPAVGPAPAQAPTPAQTPAPTPNRSLTRELSPLPPADGTVIARQGNRMKTDGNVDKSSQTAEQNLPGGKISSSPMNAQADTGGKQASPELAAKKPEVPAPATRPVPPSFESAVQLVRTDSKPAAEEAPATAVRAPQAQTLLTDVTEQVVTFRNMGVNSMNAVVRPDSATAISLQLSLHNGQVEVAARVDRGNAESLQSHWGELQTSMAQQGVRVSALHSSSSDTQTSSRTPSQNPGAAPGEQQQTPRRSLRSPQTLDELPLVGSVTEPLQAQPSTPPATASRGWEKWA